jgi:hypothetical protein
MQDKMQDQTRSMFASFPFQGTQGTQGNRK